MLVETAYLPGITASQYDEHLARGWFRGTGVLFRCQALCMSQDVFGVQHIRYSIPGYNFKSRHSKLIRRNERHFSVHVQPVSEIDEEREALYHQHAYRFGGFVHPSLREIIFTNTFRSSFNIYEVSVYDGEKLVALSYFDVGARSMASILGLFDKDYARFSLGTYTMLKELEFGINKRLEHYYPGYVLEGNSVFDYKLTLGAAQWMQAENTWVEQEAYKPVRSLSAELHERMAELKVQLSLRGFHVRKRLYPYFALGYVASGELSLLRLPWYFEFTDEEHGYAASYDVDLKSYILFITEQCVEIQDQLQLIPCSEYLAEETYQLGILRTPVQLAFNHISEVEHHLRNIPAIAS